MLASCNPQPNWIPMNPKLMLKICQKLKRGFFIVTPHSKQQSVNSSQPESRINACSWIWLIADIDCLLIADSLITLSCIDAYIFQHHISIERQRIHQRARHVGDVNKTLRVVFDQLACSPRQPVPDKN